MFDNDGNEDNQKPGNQNGNTTGKPPQPRKNMNTLVSKTPRQINSEEKGRSKNSPKTGQDKEKNKIQDDAPPFFDFTTLRSRTVQLLLASIAIASVGMNTPIFYLVC